ncbi:MAG: HlyD family efflux transporter periplasmic adaptor subunit [Cyanobacteria bacterium P01_A01_bin.84]
MLQNSKVGDSLPQRFLHHKAIMGIMATLIVGGTGIYTVQRLQVANTPVSEVVEPKIKTVTALGRLEPQGEVIKLTAPASAEGRGNRVEKLLVKRGDRVTLGQIIAVLDNRDRLSASLVEAKEQVKVARANLQKVKAGAKKGDIDAQKANIVRFQVEKDTEVLAQQAAIKRLEVEKATEISAQKATIKRFLAQSKNARTEYQRNQSLYQEGAISASLRDSKSLEYSTAQERLKEAQANLRRIEFSKEQQLEEARANLQRILSSRKQQIEAGEGTLRGIAQVRPVDVLAAQAEVDLALAAVKRAKVNLEQAYVRSPQAGTVFEIHSRPGEQVSNDGIVEIGQNNKMYVVAEVYQSDIRKVKIGQPAKIFSDSLSDELKGKVTEIASQVERQDVINADPSSNIDSRVVKVWIGLDEQSSKLARKFTNLQVRTEIEL